MRIIAQMQIYQGFESKFKIASKMGKTNLSAFTEEGIRTLETLVTPTHFPGVLLRPARGQPSSTINM